MQQVSRCPLIQPRSSEKRWQQFSNTLGGSGGEFPSRHLVVQASLKQLRARANMLFDSLGFSGDVFESLEKARSAWSMPAFGQSTVELSS